MWWLAACGAFVPATVDSGALDDTGGETGGETGGGSTAVPACINEFMPDNDAALLDDRGGTPDWIELYNPTDAALDLSGWGVTDDRDVPFRARLPAGTTLAARAVLLLYADDPAAPATGHLGFALDADGGELGLYTPDGRGSVVTYGAIAPDFAAARVPDGCEGAGCWVFDWRGTPGARNAPGEDDVAVALVADAATWAYWDGAPPAADWASPAYDDAGWPRGAAPLGYGEAVTTAVAPGGVTTWYRLAFAVDDPSTLTSLTMRLRRDDGAIVYLGGVEVARSNLGEGVVSAYTYAASDVDGTLEEATFRFGLDPALLVAGTNVVAVELHQSAAGGDDAAFALALDAVRVAAE